MISLTIVVLLVLVGSAICSGSEAALFSIPLVKARQLAQQSRQPAAQALLAIRENMNRPIASLVILNNMFNIVGSIMVGHVALTTLGNAWLGAVSALLTFLIIIFGEIIPKTLGERYAEQVAVIIALPVRGLTILLTPVVWCLEQILKPINKPSHRPTTNEAEIQLLARIGLQEGIIEDDEAEMIQKVFRLNDVTAADVMTPRTEMTYLRGSLTLAEAEEDIINSQHTRIVVIDKTVDQVIGVALRHKLLVAMLRGQQQATIASLCRKARFVPEVVRADKLLKMFQETREHLMVVLDEYGGVSGVVTLEDVLEVLTGEIVDETDMIVDLQVIARKRRNTMLADSLQPST
ncbi:MAG: hemolysin family protein [Cyanobacteria bacterium]|nr:hemolysin family protein [Cyanobacteriota bacterium]MDW8201865.1 hemolysin family protein [Cyanobacteriota bacterium SKYGB_h_bin112]